MEMDKLWPDIGKKPIKAPTKMVDKATIGLVVKLWSCASSPDLNLEGWAEENPLGCWD